MPRTLLPLLFISAILCTRPAFTQVSDSLPALLDSIFPEPEIMEEYIPDEEESFEDEYHSKEYRMLRRKMYDSCRSVMEHESAIRYERFRQLVYFPAKKNPNLPSENLRFIEELNRILAGCKNDSCGSYNTLIRPVYYLADDSSRSLRILDKFPWEESDNSYDGSGWYDDTLLTNGEKSRKWNLYFFDKQPSIPVQITKYETVAGACLYYKSFHLSKIPANDSIFPSFATPFQLQLTYSRDSVLDNMLADDIFCLNRMRSSCDSKEQLLSFARLKGAENLIFAANRDMDWQWYPSRALYLLDGNSLIPLWEFELELVGCSCR